MAPFSPKQEYEEDLPISHDKHYKLHGEIMMLIVIVMFSVFLVFLVMVPCVRRRRDPESGLADHIFKCKCHLWLPRKGRRNDEDDNTSDDNEITDPLSSDQGIAKQFQHQ
ncbi:hypothetical protein HS088_TW07G00060 [Tripterygium wilfordii]|uniref:Transmembrane protein n=1 Tax=Tripterygium wilfordii TaxID=458696 RepID=A0A7J7DE01_TRIWF|nr:hypothetical protein HS088_TW07G00060 [Tripterygium wilfordii]